ncbi:hypothetical protein OF829_00545 [Sphingomonas sp. LB-2]|uniref:hypothetical protein n=1 Tax=Sphingomonas caeni TaxID=2984949 RepID=UPI002230F132|nr:hypothetical protein [Sphingomonas caeni]MCW3845709.1 hypothetical protein [Sphingomonas caeni]
MATLAETAPQTARSDERFFLIMALTMMALVFTAFSVNLAMGRSTFARPLLVHAHAVVFMGWIVIYVLQNLLVSRGSMALHRALGWIGAGWIALMIVLGTMVAVASIQQGGVPFFFTPLGFLVFDSVMLLTFAGLTWAAIALRRRTDWHRRLHYCGMAVLMGPAFGRLLPLPLLMPWAYEAAILPTLIFPVIGMIADRRRTGAVHPAWFWGLAVMIASVLLTEAITYSPVGDAIYRAVAAGTPGAAIAPLDYPPPPAMP